MTEVDDTALVRAVAAHGLVGSLTATPSKPLDPVEWRRLLAQVRNERVIPLLADAITSGSFPASDAQLVEVLELETTAMAAVITLEATLVQVAETLARVHIPFRVLKGAAVAHLDYPDPSLRDFGDIDLLIHPDDLDRAIAILLEQGYARRFPEPRAGFDRRFTKSVSVVNPDGRELDLHRTLAAGVFGLRLKIGMLWDAPSAEFTVGGMTLHALGATERFVHACYHAVLGNAPPRMVPLRDIAQMLLHGSVDPDGVKALASQWAGAAVIAHAIRTTWQTLQLTDVVALSAWAAKHTPGVGDRRELRRATSPGYTNTARALDSARAIHPMRDRLVYLSALAFPRRSYLNGRHSSFGSRVGHAISELVAARTYGRQMGHEATPKISSAVAITRESRD
jgi:Uncharacterised nucleotidyltransferase